MAKEIESNAPASEFPLSIDEWCASHSQTDRRVELIGAFHSDEKSAGRAQDLPSNYLRRYNEFLNKPA